MSFKNPLILYALFLLLIPVIIHLVRWKKYKKTEFTNVDFLKELEIKSRKSRQLKELIVLALRMLALAMLILAFARPFIPSQAYKNQILKTKNLIFLDNSLSLSALNGPTTLWQDLLQELQKLPAGQTYTVITNNRIYNNVKGDFLPQVLYDIPFSNQPAQHTANLNKIKLLLDRDNQTRHNIIYASDLQNVYNEQLTDSLFAPDVYYHFLTRQVPDLANISIDSLWLTGQDIENYHLSLKVSANVPELKTPVQVSQGNEILWRTQINFKDSLQQQINLILPHKNMEAKVSVFDKAFRFDNDLYFTLQQNPVINVLVIGDKLPEFAQKIYSGDEFKLDFRQPGQVNYDELNRYDLILIYAYKNSYNLPGTLLSNYLKQYGNIVLIPGDVKAAEMQNFLQNFHINTSVALDTNRVLLNKINYQHPFFKGVFLKPVQNFSYPFVQKHFLLNPHGEWLYRLNDRSAFAQIFRRNGNLFFINAPLEPENTNFTQAASLIVPLFYQMALTQNKTQDLYFVLGQKNTWFVKKEIAGDETIRLKNGNEEFIPYQQNQFRKIQLQTGELPSKAGIYHIIYRQQKIGSVAFNYNRAENRLSFLKLPALKNISQANSLKNFLTEQKHFNQDKPLWKWLLIAALLFLLMEMLVIRFWK